MVHVRACVCIYGHGCMLAVGLYVSVSVCPCTYMPACGCGNRAQAAPSPGPGACGHTSCNSPNDLELGEATWGAWKARLMGMQGPSVSLSFGPRNENPPDPRAVQLRPLSLPAPSFHFRPPASSWDFLGCFIGGFLMGRERRVSPSPQLSGEMPGMGMVWGAGRRAASRGKA